MPRTTSAASLHVSLLAGGFGDGENCSIRLKCVFVEKDG